MFACVINTIIIRFRLCEALLAADPHIMLIGVGGYIQIPSNNSKKIIMYYACRNQVRMSEAINDPCAFTRLTDGVFQDIKSSASPKLQKVWQTCGLVDIKTVCLFDDNLLVWQAREILQQVDQRKLYRFICRTLPNRKKPTVPVVCYNHVEQYCCGTAVLFYLMNRRTSHQNWWKDSTGSRMTSRLRIYLWM